jgi:hypothetical protein
MHTSPSHDQPKFERTEFRTSHGELTDKLAELFSKLRQHSIPERRHNRYQLPITPLTYTEFPPSLRDYVVSDEVNSLTLDFIYEYDSETDLIEQETGFELEDKHGRSVILDGVESLDTGYYYKAYSLNQSSKPQEIPSCPSTEIARLLLRALNESPAILDKGDFSGFDMLSPERTDTLEKGVEAYGFRLFKTESYSVDRIAHVTIIDEDSADEPSSSLPTEIIVNFKDNPFKVIVSTRNKFEIIIYEDDVELIRPDDDILNEVIENIQTIINAIDKDDSEDDTQSSIEILVSPQEIERSYESASQALDEDRLNTSDPRRA